jgi:hypothetical protein
VKKWRATAETDLTPSGERDKKTTFIKKEDRDDRNLTKIDRLRELMKATVLPEEAAAAGEGHLGKAHFKALVVPAAASGCVMTMLLVLSATTGFNHGAGKGTTGMLDIILLEGHSFPND